MGADECVSLSCPRKGSRLDVVEVERLQPILLLRGELARLDLIRELVRPALRVVVRTTTSATDQFLGDGAIPYVVQVEVGAVPLHVDSVAPSSDVLVVKWLVDIADEVDDESSRLVALPTAELRIQRPGGVVC